MFLTNETAVLAMASLGGVLAILFLASVVHWLRNAGRQPGNALGRGRHIAGQFVNGEDDRIMSVTVNIPWMNGSWSAEPILEKSTRN
jgi:hypothetical protein